MKKLALIFAASASLAAGGCATITQGSKQTVYFDTDPSGAKCTISREGEGVLYSEITTPASLEISKDKDQMKIVCNKDGYKETTVFTDSNFEGWTMGNLLLGGVIGLGVDAASGALNEYPSNVVIPLKKE